MLGVRATPRGSVCRTARCTTLPPLEATLGKSSSGKNLLDTPLHGKMAQNEQPKPSSALPDHVLRAIRGELTEEEKQAQLDKSLSSWWKEYAARKNDEDQEHVADSLLYDERCHLPRTAPPPTLSDGSKVSAATPTPAPK